MIPAIHISHLYTNHYNTIYLPEEPRIHATVQPRTSHRASEVPRIACLGLGDPLHDFPSLPCSIVDRYGLSVTQKGWVSPVKRKGLTLLPTIVRRPQHLPYGYQLWSPERSTHFSLSSHNIPDSSGLGKPPSRTLLLSCLSSRTNSLFSQLSITEHSHVFLYAIYTLLHSSITH